MTSPRIRFAALTAAGALALSAVAGCSSDQPTRTASDTTSPDASNSASADPTEAATTDAPSPDAEPTDGGLEVTVPVYFAGQTPQGLRLYREFRRVSAANPLEESAALLTAGDTLDPDYQGLFPGGSFTSVELSADSIVVTVPDDGWATRPAGMNKTQARLAAASLVYSLQGVAQARKPVSVQTADGAVVPLFGVESPITVQKGRELNTLALVNITAPEQGSAVSGDTLSASGRANSFEATVPWQILRGSDVVLDGFATADGAYDKLYPWQTEIDVSGLEPGAYTFVAMTADPSDGEGGGPVQDTKDFTVE